VISSPNLIIEGSHPYGEDKVWDLCMWLCNNLLPDIGYEIVVTFRKFNKDDGDAQGFHLTFDQDSHEVHISNKLTYKQAMIAITHEFIHVQQYMNGLLKEDSANMYWRGKFIPDSTPYFDRPWEKHARRNENKVYKQYLGAITHC